MRFYDGTGSNEFDPVEFKDLFNYN